VAGASATAGTSAVAGASAGGSTATTLNGCTTDITDAKLNDEYAKWKTAYLRDCSTTQARVQAGGSATGSESSETFSEGIGYGMLLAASFNDEATLKKLWAYYKSALDKNGLMNWKMNACTGNYYEANGASDGDLDTAMGLVMADRRWGGYTADATALLDAIRTSETMECSGLTVLRPGDAWGLDCNTGSLNPSYFSPGYYRAFAVFQPSQAAFWNKFADDTVQLLLTYQQNAGGALMGEWASVQKLADTSYGYNACRTPWRVAVDYVWWGTADSKKFLTNVSSYVDSKGGVAQVPYDKNSAFLGPFALSGIATGKCDAYYQSWMTGAQYDDRYFQGTLRVLAMLVMAGKFTF
jgi:endo-1,4-beta-D-glucanase Y